MAQTDKSKHGEARPSPVLLILLIIPLLGILIALVMVALDLTAAPPSLTDSVSEQATSLLNTTAPDFELPTLDGDTVALSDLRGQTVLLNFWQTTCVPCLKEIPDLADFYADERPNGVTVLAVNFDESPALVQSFFENNGFDPLPVALDENSAVRDSYGVVGIPVTYIIDTQGIIRTFHIGAMTYDDMGSYVAGI